MFRHKWLLLLSLVSIASSAFGAGEWETNYAKALARAKAENKRVLLDFTGSDWCPFCIALRRQVFTTAAFRTYAQKNLILVEIDYPHRKQQPPQLKNQNAKLRAQYQIDEKGFPTVVLLDPAGRVVREFSEYNGESASDVIAWIEGRKRR